MKKDIYPECATGITIGKFVRGGRRPMMAMVEITSRCNMSCPLCFADVRRDGTDLSLDAIKERVDMVVDTAGPIPLQISGGEPTLHPELEEVIVYARNRGIRNIELVSNGILLASKPTVLSRLSRAGLTAVYLQFDGLRQTTHEYVRGQDMRSVRQDAVGAIRAAGLCCTLAVAVVRGVNDDELGDIVDFAIDNIDTVRAINFQAAARFAGRYEMQSRQGEGYSLAELIKLIETQAALPPGGFITDLLGHPECNGMSLLFVQKEQREPIFSHISRDTLKRFVNSGKQDVVTDLFLGREHFLKKHLFNPRAWKLFHEASGILGKKLELRTLLGKKHILLFAKSFMEKDALSANRLDACNYAIADQSGLYSFCAYNNLQRFRLKSQP